LLPAREKHVPSDIGEEVHLSEMSELPQRGYGHSSYYDDDDVISVRKLFYCFEQYQF